MQPLAKKSWNPGLMRILSKLIPMKVLRKIILLSATALFLFCFSCERKTDYRELMEKIPAFHLENYPFFNPESPLADRIIPAPEFILTYLKNMDKRDDYEVYAPTDEEHALCADYLDKLPEQHKKVLEKRLVGIYFIKNFLGSGMADFVLDQKETIYCNLFINSATLQNDISSWMTQREDSCFKEEPDTADAIRIVQDCGNEYTGFMYILLHETTHVVDYVCTITPYLSNAIKEILNKKLVHTRFTKGVWDTYYTPVKEYDYVLRSEITFYGLRGGPKISKRDAETVYRRCGETPFASLYGSQNWTDDLAEFVTWHYYTSVLNQPYEIRIYQGDVLMHSFKPMEGEKVRQRVPLVEEIFRTLPDVL